MFSQSNLVQPILTPRFAISCDQTLMRSLATLASERKLNIQTHISENVKEIAFVKEKYNMSYASVYDSVGILTPKVKDTYICFFHVLINFYKSTDHTSAWRLPYRRRAKTTQ